MFDRTVNVDETSINITQQPNDAADAARLHGEVKAKALKEAEHAVIEHFGAKNEINVVKTHHEVNHFDNNHHVKALFQLNGVDYVVQVSEPEHATLDSKVGHRLAELITDKIFQKIFHGKPNAASRLFK